MPRVYTQRANKDYPQQGIKKGDTYFSWSFRFGGSFKSLTRPTRSQLTQSSFLSQVYSIYDTTIAEADDPSSLRAAIDDLDSAQDEAQSSLDSMPEGLQQGPTGELLQTRIDACEEAKTEIESAADTAEEEFETIERREALHTEYHAEGTTEARQAELEEDDDWHPDLEDEDWDADEARADVMTEARSSISEPDWG